MLRRTHLTVLIAGLTCLLVVSSTTCSILSTVQAVATDPVTQAASSTGWVPTRNPQTGQAFTTWLDAWQLPQAGQGVIEFTATKSPDGANFKDFYLCLSPTKLDANGAVRNSNYPADPAVDTNLLFLALCGWNKKMSGALQGVRNASHQLVAWFADQTRTALKQSASTPTYDSFPDMLLSQSVDVRVEIDQLNTKRVLAFIKNTGEAVTSYKLVLAYPLKNNATFAGNPWRYFSFANPDIQYSNLRVLAYNTLLDPSVQVQDSAGNAETLIQNPIIINPLALISNAITSATSLANNLANNIVQAVTSNLTPGNPTTYTSVSTGNPFKFMAWYDGWKLPQPGQGVIEFTAQDPNGVLSNVLVCCSPQGWAQTGAINGQYPADAWNNTPLMYLILGGWGNKLSALVQGVSVTTPLQTSWFDQTGTLNNKLTSAWPAPDVIKDFQDVLPGATGPVDFRMEVDQVASKTVIVYAKKSGDPASNYKQILKYQDAQNTFSQQWQYFSFSSYWNTINYSNIAVKPYAALPQTMGLTSTVTEAANPTTAAVTAIAKTTLTARAKKGSFATWNDVLAFATPGKAAIEFTVTDLDNRQINDVYCCFSPTQSATDANSLSFAIGGWTNSASEGWVGGPYNMPALFRIQGTNNKVLPTAIGSLDFRIEVDQLTGNGSFTVYTRPTGAPATSFTPCLTFQGSAYQALPKTPWQYFSFSSYENNLQFSNITVKPMAPVAQGSTSPAAPATTNSAQNYTAQNTGLTFADWYDQWALPTPGVGAIEMSVQTAHDLFFAMSPIQFNPAARDANKGNDVNDASWWFAFGGNANTTMLAFQGLSDTSNKKFGQQMALPNGWTAANPGTNNPFDMRIEINQTEHPVGTFDTRSNKTLVVPANSLVVRTKPANSGADAFTPLVTIPLTPGLAQWKYFSFGSQGDAAGNKAVLTNITVMPLLQTQSTPAGFEAEVGTTEVIAAGGGDFYCSAFDNKSVWKLNPSAAGANPWVPVTTAGLDANTTIEDLACGADNTFCVLNSQGGVYKYDGNQNAFALLTTQTPRQINAIAVGDANNIWGIDSTGQVVRYNGSDWTTTGMQGALDISVNGSAYNAMTVVAISAEGLPFSFDATANTWTQLPGLPAGNTISQIAVANSKIMYAISADSRLWANDGFSWNTVKNSANTAQDVYGMASISVNANGCGLANDAAGNIFITKLVVPVTYISAANAPAIAAPAIAQLAPVIAVSLPSVQKERPVVCGWAGPALMLPQDLPIPLPAPTLANPTPVAQLSLADLLSSSNAPDVSSISIDATLIDADGNTIASDSMTLNALAQDQLSTMIGKPATANVKKVAVRKTRRAQAKATKTLNVAAVKAKTAVVPQPKKAATPSRRTVLKKTVKKSTVVKKVVKKVAVKPAAQATPTAAPLATAAAPVTKTVARPAATTVKKVAVKAASGQRKAPARPTSRRITHTQPAAQNKTPQSKSTN